MPESDFRLQSQNEWPVALIRNRETAVLLAAMFLRLGRPALPAARASLDWQSH